MPTNHFNDSMLNLTISPQFIQQCNNNSKQFKNEMPIDIIIYGTFFYVLIFLIGLVGNLLVIIVTLKIKELRNFTNYLLANLSIADLLVLLTNVPTGLHDLFAKERWYLGKAMCYLIYFFENCTGNASILTILFITCERFYVICRPLSVKYLMTQSRILRIILFIWLVSILLNLPFIFMSEYRMYNFYDCTKAYKCYLQAKTIPAHIYSITVSYVIYFVIGIILLYMYYKISVQLGKSNAYLISFSLEKPSSLINSNSSANNDSTNNQNNQIKIKANSLRKYEIRKSSNGIGKNRRGSNNNKRRSNYYKTSQGELFLLRKNTFNCEENQISYSTNSLEKFIKQRRQLIQMLMFVIFVFYVCLFPLKIWNLLLMFLSHKQSFIQVIRLRHYWYINITVRIFYYINSSINPILYNCLSAKFRSSFRKLSFLKKVKSTDELSERSMRFSHK